MSSSQPFRNINSTINAGETDQRQRRYSKDSAGCCATALSGHSLQSLAYEPLKIHFPGHLSGVLCSVNSSLPQLNRKKKVQEKEKKSHPTINNQ